MGHEPLVASVAEALRRQADVSAGWMAWNLFLALTPWMLSVVLFRPHRRPGPVWLAVVVGWSLLLPNAAYVLTDVVHLPAAARQEPSDHLVLLAVLPLYGAFFIAGFIAYADGLRRLRRHVTGLGWVPWASWWPHRSSIPWKSTRPVSPGICEYGRPDRHHTALLLRPEGLQPGDRGRAKGPPDIGPWGRE
jgi:hypothetical protein